MKNQKEKTQTITKSWTWHQAWGNTFPIPRTVDGERLLSEGNISLKQALLWTVSVSAISNLLTTSSPLIKNPASISLRNILLLLGNSLITGLLSPIGFFLVTGIIHGLSKLFGGKGSWRNFYIVNITFSAPIMILFGISALIYQAFSVNFALFLGALLSFYFLLVIGPASIKVNYHFRWLGAFLISIFVDAVWLVAILGFFIVFNPGLLQR